MKKNNIGIGYVALALLLLVCACKKDKTDPVPDTQPLANNPNAVLVKSILGVFPDDEEGNFEVQYAYDDLKRLSQMDFFVPNEPRITRTVSYQNNKLVLGPFADGSGSTAYHLPERDKIIAIGDE